MAIDQALHKRLTYDIIRQHRLPAILCSNDAKSCYDRILHPIASLAYRRVGVPLAPVKCMLECIQEMKHHIRTSYGLSDDTFDMRDLEEKLQGILQGNGAAPATWVLISTPLLNMLRNKGYGGRFLSPITLENTNLVGFVFVDDSDLILLDMIDGSIGFEEIAEKMQEAINLWESGLKTTGGAIVPNKSWLYPIDFEANSTKAEYVNAEEIEQVFTVKDHKDVTRDLQKVKASQGMETLGVFLAPDGSNDEAVTKLKQKASNWHDNIMLGQLQRDIAWQASQTTIMKSLEYPLVALTLSEEECKTIMAPVKKATLAKTSINRTYPHALLYGQREEGGLGMHDLFVTQGLSHLQKFHQHHGWGTITDKLLTVSLETAILETGIGHNIFDLDYNSFHMLVSDSWIKGLWKFCHIHSITIQDRKTKYPSLLRERDVFLMEIFANEGFSEGQLKKLNQCRMYLQVLRLSEITNGYGNSFTIAYRVQKDGTRKSPYRWPRTPRPGSTAIKLWRAALRKTFGLKTGILEYTVGNWLANPPDHWVWFYNESTRLVYQRFGGLWRVWKKATRRGKDNGTFQIRYVTNALSLPPTSTRATVELLTATRAKFTGWKRHQTGSEGPDLNEVDINYLPIDNQLILGEKDQIAQQLQSESLIAVCDGSFLKSESAGAAAWVLETDDQNSSMEGSLVVPGAEADQNAYRSELFGILGVLVMVTAICKEYQIQAGGITIYCDGESAVKRVNNSRTQVSNKSQHFDVINSILSCCDNLPIGIKLKHIKGHQDDHMPYSSLSRPAQLNIMVDYMAKAAATEAINTNTIRRDYPLPFSKCDIQIARKDGGVEKVCSNLITTIRDAIQRCQTRDYWAKKKDFQETQHLVDWELRGKGLKNLPLHKSRWYSKFTSGFCGTGKMLKRYRFQDHDHCPRCNEEHEGTTHVLQCQHEAAVNLRKKELDDLVEWMDKEKVQPEIIHAVSNIWTNWCDQRHIITSSNCDVIAQALRQQQLIGWKSFLEGFWAKNFRLGQENYLAVNGIQKSALLLLSKVQRRIWHIAWLIWTDRNTYLHEARNSIHPQEETQLNDEIAYEHRKGLASLPTVYQPVFNTTLQQILTRSIQHKVAWLFGVWVAREAVYPAYLSLPSIEFPNSTLRFKYVQWKEKIL